MPDSGSTAIKGWMRSLVVITGSLVGLFILMLYGKVEIHSKHFGGQKDLLLIPKIPGLEANIHINTTYQRSWSKFPDLQILSRFPTTVRLQFWDSRADLAEVFIKTVELTHKGGADLSIPLDWSRTATTATMTYQNGKTTYSYVWDNLPPIIGEFQDVTIKLTGALHYADGKNIEFETDPVLFPALDHYKVERYFEFFLTQMLGA